jgi:hypothetical protein
MRTATKNDVQYDDFKMAPSQSLIVGYQKLVVQVSALTKQEALEWADAIRETARDQSNKTFFPSNLFLRTWTC